MFCNVLFSSKIRINNILVQQHITRHILGSLLKPAGFQVKQRQLS